MLEFSNFKMAFAKNLLKNPPVFMTDILSFNEFLLVDNILPCGNSRQYNFRIICMFSHFTQNAIFFAYYYLCNKGIKMSLSIFQILF